MSIRAPTLLRIGFFLLAPLMTSGGWGGGIPAQNSGRESLLLRVAAAAGGAGPDSREDRTVIGRTINWLSASEMHSPGKADSAAVFIGAWPVNDLYSVLNCIAGLIRSGIKDVPNGLRDNPQLLRFFKDPNQSLKRGALLHTDISILQLDTGYRGRYAARQIRNNDGLGTLEPAGAHWEISRRLLDKIGRNPPLDEMVRQWYIATCAYMFFRRNWGAAEIHLARAMQIFPRNAKILFYAGVFHEINASPYIQSINSRPQRGVKANVGSRKSELKRAREFFRKSIAIDSQFPEVHLHRGRVMGLLGDHDKAVAELQQAERGIKDPPLEYYCSLYLGYELVILNRRDEARRKFENAATLYPNAQSPLLSLSQMALSGGESENAFLAVQKVFKLPTGGETPEDPWFVYDVSHVHDLSTLLLEMYEAFGGLGQ